MSKKTYLTPADAPVELALVLVCEKCGKRAGGSRKNPSHYLASKIKRLGKHEFERGRMRAVLTSCLDLCPENRVTVAIVPTGLDRAPQFLEAEIDDIDAASAAVIDAIRRL